MTERDSYQPGTPNWIDIGSPDPGATADFYSALFGWQVDEADPDPQYGGYRMASLKGRAVAGIGPAQSEGVPPWWTTYVSVDDASTTAKLVQDAGGQVLVEPFEVATFGRLAVFADPSGAPFSVWQPIQHIGCGLVNEHGTLTWNELHSRDVDLAKDFYGKVFGWHPRDVDMGGFHYTLFALTGDEDAGRVAGLMPMGENQGGRFDHWKVYFAVDDCDATAASVTGLGGNVIMQPETMPGVGRMAALTGPHGEEIMIINNESAAQS